MYDLGLNHNRDQQIRMSLESKCSNTTLQSLLSNLPDNASIPINGVAKKSWPEEACLLPALNYSAKPNIPLSLHYTIHIFYLFLTAPQSGPKLKRALSRRRAGGKLYITN